MTHAHKMRSLVPFSVVWEYTSRTSMDGEPTWFNGINQKHSTERTATLKSKWKEQHSLAITTNTISTTNTQVQDMYLAERTTVALVILRNPPRQARMVGCNPCTYMYRGTHTCYCLRHNSTETTANAAVDHPGESTSVSKSK